MASILKDIGYAVWTGDQLLRDSLEWNISFKKPEKPEEIFNSALINITLSLLSVNSALYQANLALNAFQFSIISPVTALCYGISLLTNLVKDLPSIQKDTKLFHTFQQVDKTIYSISKIATAVSSVALIIFGSYIQGGVVLGILALNSIRCGNIREWTAKLKLPDYLLESAKTVSALAQTLWGNWMFKIIGMYNLCFKISFHVSDGWVRCKAHFSTQIPEERKKLTPDIIQALRYNFVRSLNSSEEIVFPKTEKEFKTALKYHIELFDRYFLFDRKETLEQISEKRKDILETEPVDTNDSDLLKAHEVCLKPVPYPEIKFFKWVWNPSAAPVNAVGNASI